MKERTIDKVRSSVCLSSLNVEKPLTEFFASCTAGVSNRKIKKEPGYTVRVQYVLV